MLANQIRLQRLHKRALQVRSLILTRWFDLADSGQTAKRDRMMTNALRVMLATAKPSDKTRCRKLAADHRAEVEMRQRGYALMSDFR